MNPRMPLVALLAVLLLSAMEIFAQTFPARQVRIVVPFPPGGSSDAVARVIAERLGEEWKQPVLVENRPGAGTNIAGAYVAAAAPDGHTLFLQGVATYASTGSLYRNLSFDPLKSFAPVTMLCTSPFILVSRAGLGAATARDLVELARSRPGSLTYGSSGTGGTPHLFVEMMARATGTKFLHVPYKGVGPAIVALLGGEVDFLAADVAVMPQVRAGKVRALAVTGPVQSSFASGVPTMAESGVPGLVMQSAIAMLTTAGVPREIVGVLNTQINRALANAEVRKKLTDLGFEPAGGTAEDLGSLMAAEVQRFSQIIRETGVKLD